MKAKRILRLKSCSCSGTCEASSDTRTLHCRATGPAAARIAPAVVHRVLGSTGHALAPDPRGFFEHRFGHDFSGVRVHADTQADESARAVNAAAWTVGEHIAFAGGKYDPHSEQGRELLAHELAHTIQQHDSPPHGPIELGDSQDRAEQQADQSAAAALNGGTPPETAPTPAALQRQPLPPDAPVKAPNLAEGANPFLAGAVGSTTIDGFVTGKSEVLGANKANLERTADTIKTLLKRYPNGQVNVTGHTDAVGKEDSNMTLGQARADAAKDVLVKAGVPEAILHTLSKGESELLVKSKGPESRNRRVEAHFNPGAVPPPMVAPGQVTQEKNPEITPEKKPPPNLFDFKHLPITPDNPRAPFRPPQPDYFKPIPPLPHATRKSAADVFDDVAHKLTSFLPKKLQKPAQDAVKAALMKGTTAGLDTALQQAGVDDKTRAALGKAAEATLQQKFGGTP